MAHDLSTTFDRAGSRLCKAMQGVQRRSDDEDGGAGAMGAVLR